MQGVRHTHLFVITMVYRCCDPGIRDTRDTRGRGQDRLEALDSAQVFNFT